MSALISLLVLSGLASTALAACISSGDQTDINSALSSGGSGAIVQLCPGAVIEITGSIQFTADDQEISTQGYPTGTTRATIKPASSSGDLSTLVIGSWYDGIKIRNLIVDGDRPTLGKVVDGGASIEIGGGTNGQIVEYVASKNARGWSCLHVIGSGDDSNPCKNATISNNDIGPCGEEGSDSNGNSNWADGISFDCTAGLVQNNVITGSTDGGIVLFGAPGTTVEGNTITSSTTNRGFGAINMVDGEYAGSYANVVVKNNVVTGEKLFNLGIGIGAYVWSFNDDYLLSGPATITGNTFSGNITFPIAVNGWEGGLTITGNDVSGVNNPKSSFADDVECSSAVQSVFSQSADLVYYPGGVSGTTNLQSDFVAASSNVTNFLCTTPPLPSTTTYALNELAIVSDSAPFAELHGGILMQYQGDSNVVVYDTSSSGWTALWASGHTVSSCGSPSLCHLNFQGDGNLVTYYNGTALWSTGTAGSGNVMVCRNVEPWIEILNADGNIVWSTSS